MRKWQQLVEDLHKVVGIKNHNTVDVNQQQQQHQNNRMPVNGIADLNRY